MFINIARKIYEIYFKHCRHSEIEIEMFVVFNICEWYNFQTDVCKQCSLLKKTMFSVKKRKVST